MAVDEDIGNAVAGLISAAIPAVPCDHRKVMTLREGEESPRIIVRCVFERSQAGENGTNQKLNNFYHLTIRLVKRTNQQVTIESDLKNWRQTVNRLLFGPTLSGVAVVDDIRPVQNRVSALPQLPKGVDSEAISFEVETFEPLTV